MRRMRPAGRSLSSLWRLGPLLVVATACGGGGSASSAPTDLYESSFVAEEVREHGEAHEPVSGHVQVDFERDQFEGYEQAALVRWDAGCNEFEARIEITSQQLVAIPHAMRGPQVEGEESQLSPAAEGSDRSCTDAEHEQDEWLADFFLSDPAWVLDEETLVLESDTAEMLLEKR